MCVGVGRLILKRMSCWRNQSLCVCVCLLNKVCYTFTHYIPDAEAGLCVCVCVDVSLCWQVYIEPTLMPRELLNQDNSPCWKELRQQHSSLIYRISAVFTCSHGCLSVFLTLMGSGAPQFLPYSIWEEAINLPFH